MSFAYGNPDSTLLENKPDPIRIAMMPFCNESPSLAVLIPPDRQKMYNYAMFRLKGLSDCTQAVEWVSKNKTGKTIASYISQTENKNQITSSCDNDLTSSVCEEINADIIILGEYIVGQDKSVEVYYSYQKCEGIYASEIDYLTEQPIIGTTDDLTEIYRQVGDAIKQDLQQFLDCESGNKQLDEEISLQEGKVLYESGDKSPLNYLKAIDFFESKNTDHGSSPEIKYYIGLSYFAIGEYKKAEVFLSEIGDFEDAVEYLNYCKLESRPAIWYKQCSQKEKMVE